MKRLREQHDSTDPSIARAAALLSRVEPTPDSPARMRRIRRTLERPPKRYVLRLPRPIAILGVVMGIAATAAAGYGVVQVVDSLTEHPRELKPGTHGSTNVAFGKVNVTPGRADTPPTAKPQLETMAPPSWLRSATETDEDIIPGGVTTGNPRPVGSAASPARTGSSAGPLRGNGSRQPAAPSPSAQQHVASEAQLVQQGLEALRKHNDPKQAAVYLERYRNEQPDGTLSEEALALSVEAASVSGDSRAKGLAMEYLTRYPQGRFKEAARQALAKALAAEPAKRKRPGEKRSPTQRKRE